MFRRTSSTSARLAVVGVLLCAAPARAQTVNYGALESLFGEPVTTSATGQPQRASEVPVDMEIITAEDIRRSGAATIPDALRMYSSLSVWNWTQSTYDVNVRGYNQPFSPRLLVLINGRQIYSDSYGNTIWQDVPVQMEEIRQIEVVEGPNSALFGFNAVSGVINIITYNPLYTPVSGFGARVGTNAYQQGHVFRTAKFGEKAAFRVSGGATQSRDFSDTGNMLYLGMMPFYHPTRSQASLDGVVQMTEDSQLRIEATKSQSKVTEYPFIVMPINAQYEENSLKATVTADTRIGLVQANVYRNWHKMEALFFSNNSNDVIVAQLEDLFRVGSDHILRLQAEYRRNSLHGSLLSPGAEVYYDVYAAGSMWNWKIRDGLSWTNALRLDNLVLGRSGPLVANPVVTSNAAFDQAFVEISYNSGLVWNPTAKDTLRLTTARGVQAPALTAFGIDFGMGGFISQGNPLLHPTIITNYELGYDRGIGAINGLFRGSVFYQRLKDLMSVSALTTGAVTQADNIGASDLVGMKLGFQGAFAGHWKWGANYTALKADDDLTVNQGGVMTVPYAATQSTPTHTANLHLGWADGPWEVDGYAQYVSSYDVVGLNGFAYTLTRAGDSVNVFGRVGRKLGKGVTVSLSGQELNHAHATETSGPRKDRQVFLSLSASF